MRLGGWGARALKSLHLGLTGVWLGGVAAMIPLAVGADTGDLHSLRVTYLDLRAIAWNVVGWGGIGSLATGLALGGFTSWGLFRQRWTIAKLVLTVYAIAFGMLFVERQMLAGLALLESSAPAGENFAYHHERFIRGLLAQTATFLGIVAIAVFKPGFGQRSRIGAPHASSRNISGS